MKKCIRCNRPAEDGMSQCIACRNLDREYKHKEVQNSKALGECIVCGCKEEAVNKSYCESHRKIYLEYAAEFRRRKRLGLVGFNPNDRRMSR